MLPEDGDGEEKQHAGAVGQKASFHGPSFLNLNELSLFPSERRSNFRSKIAAQS